MYNFSSARLQPSVQCDSVEDDSYPATNLVSPDPRVLGEGFMAYSVTKPPVELEFQLFCPIAIHRIKVWTKLGALKTTCVEILSKSKNGMFHKIGSGESQHADIFEFINAKRETSSDSACARFDLFPTMGHLLASSSVIKVVLRKTARCVPVLRKIEIWGKPATHCQQSVKDSVHKLWIPTETCGNSVHEVTNKELTTEIRDKIDSRVQDVPEEFLDELTCDIMSLPMILPSGKVVDQRTIERCNQQEETWGRQPSDPFTGLIYTDSRKPKFCAALKSRIDQFLIKHSDTTKFQHIPRTIGTKFKPPALHSRANFPKRIKQCSSSAPVSLNLSCSSLEAAVSQALATSIRYTQPNPPALNVAVTSCRSCMATSGALYRIGTCQHLICRFCLDLQYQDESAPKCACGSVFERRSVERYHS
uniref:RING finger protein 37 n=1 Tax=Culex pipiens TaxID=7175 RepID=A0A8D8CEH8_CULPI